MFLSDSLPPLIEIEAEFTCGVCGQRKKEMIRYRGEPENIEQALSYISPQAKWCERPGPRCSHCLDEEKKARKLAHIDALRESCAKIGPGAAAFSTFLGSHGIWIRGDGYYREPQVAGDAKSCGPWKPLTKGK